MKLSEAIVKGCEMSRPTQGAYILIDSYHELRGTQVECVRHTYACALGAAALAIRLYVGTTVSGPDVGTAVRDVATVLQHHFGSLLFNNGFPTEFGDTITRRNDAADPNDPNDYRLEVAAWLAEQGL